MKKLLLTLLAVMVTVAVNAERVSKQEALLKAQQFMPDKQFGEVKAFARGEKADSPAEYEAFYVFNAEGKKGFVIISGDDRTEPILGYSDRGSLNVDSVPDNVKGLLNYYEKVLTAIVNDKNYTRPARTRGTEGRATVEPMLTTKWDQGFPYNLKCPIIDEKRCVTGCVATAMAQVMNYHQWPMEETTTIPGYLSEMNQISMPELKPQKFGWGYLGARELGALMLYCGQAVQMEYGVNGSGAFAELVPFALQNYFGYKDNVQHVVRENYSDDDWDQLIYNEMVENRPVIYGGYSSDNAGDAGHAFVVDGFKSGRFHVNWGWGGLYNGDFMLTGLNPGIDSYNDSQYAVIGIQSPEDSRVIIRPHATVIGALHEGSKYLWRQSNGSFPSFNLKFSIETMSSDNETLQLGFALCDKNGLIKVYAQETQEIAAGSSYWHDAFINIDKDIADGEYCILPVSRKYDTEPWSVDESDVYRMGVQPDFFTEFVISDNLLKLIVENYWPTCSVYDRDYCGYIEENGITYDLWHEFGKNRATVVPKQSDGYSGDIFIPDVVTFSGDDYLVYDADDYAFTNCPNLSSLSIGMFEGPQIANCPKLTNLELREGIKYYIGSISDCASLEEIIFPKSVDELFQTPFGCEKLKTIRFENPYLFYINTRPLWNNYVLPSLTDIYFSSQYPPYIFWIYEDGFPVNTNTIVHVPHGSLAAYRNSSWKDWCLSDDYNGVSNQISWGYCIENDQTDNKTEEYGQVVETAIRVPSDMIKPYINKKITNIQFYSWSCDYTWPDYVFVAKSGTTNYLSKQLAGKNYNMGGWCNIMLQEPCLITGEELLVGLGRKDLLGVYASSMDLKETESSWVRKFGIGGDTDGEWVNVADNNSNFAHPMTIRFIIEGENMPNDVRLCYPKLDDEKAPTKVMVNLVNRCAEVLASYTFNWDFDGKVKGTKTIKTCIASNLVETLNVDLPLDLDIGHHTLTLDVKKVNGEDDVVPANSHIVYEFTTSDFISPHTMLGDANSDGIVDEKDIESIIHYILTGDNKDFNFENGDMNSDTEVNAADLVLLINEVNKVNSTNN